jgi:UDP-N-acetylmuramoylalanine--D-glutamate ligase
VIPVTTRKGRRIALFGLGGSGLATALALLEGGAAVTAFDDDPARVADAGARGIAARDFRETGLGECELLVLAPGVPLTHPRPHWVVELASRANVPIAGDIELFAEERRVLSPRARFIAITGTNGKSTTTALIGHILRSAGRDAQIGGNIGAAALSLQPFAPGRDYVLECSSYQIDLAPTLDPTVGVLLNVTPDHLDRHGGMERYASIKERLVAGSAGAVVGVDDSCSAGIAARLTAGGRRVTRISGARQLDDGVYAKAGRLYEARDGEHAPVADLTPVRSLRGQHNGQNAAAAWACCREAGLSREQISVGLSTFAGLVHRMEPVARIGNIWFINDSKATNADAAGKALASFPRIYWIAGGLAKEGGIASLRPFFPRIAKAYLVGEAAPAFAATLGGEAPYEIAQTISVAVARAAADARQDDAEEVTVLLSPACASFDQFANFERRGDAFREAVLSLPGARKIEEECG